MKIAIIHGQSHKGSTYHIAHMLAEKINGDIKEFFLPRDFGEFCVGCTMCFMESEMNELFTVNNTTASKVEVKMINKSDLLNLI